ncbi:MAG: class I SAM-dependent methyltransferase [Candidatus Aceula meridiana]|nr:class I SAM-dependent methyltransferase [Candidatus Aceula meridiana]
MNIEQIFCPVCSTLEHKTLFPDHNRRDNIDCSGVYVQCVGCSLVYLAKRPPWEEIVKCYSFMDENQPESIRHNGEKKLSQEVQKPVPGWKQILRKIYFRPHSWPLEIVPQGSKRLLDLGCGSGVKLFEFAERGYEIWGVDVGIDAIRLCREILPQGYFLRGELQQTGLPDGYFDYIRIDNALEHVPNPKEVIRECRRILSKSGKLLIYVPHGRSLSMRFMKGNSISSWIPFHLQLFTRRSLKRLLVDAGFNDTRIYGYNPISWLPMSIMQGKGKNQPIAKFNYPRWLAYICYPIGWVAVKIGIAEELVAIGKEG